MYVPVVAGGPAAAAALLPLTPPEVPEVAVTYKELEDLWEKMESNEIPKQAFGMMNTGLKWTRDEAQGLDNNKWANPAITAVDFTSTDKFMISTTDRSKAGENMIGADTLTQMNRLLIVSSASTKCLPTQRSEDILWMQMEKMGCGAGLYAMHRARQILRP